MSVRYLPPAQPSRNFDARFDVSEEYVSRAARRPDPHPDFAFDLFGGAVIIAVVFLGCLVIAVNASRFIVTHFHHAGAL